MHGSRLRRGDYEMGAATCAGRAEKKNSTGRDPSDGVGTEKPTLNPKRLTANEIENELPLL